MKRFAIPAALLVAACQPRAAQVSAPASSSESFRVSVWNVAESTFVQRPEVVHCILRETGADVFSFDEVGEHTTPADLVRVLRGLRGAADTTWHMSRGLGGDYQRTVIASRTPLESVPEFSPLPFPASSDRILRIAPDSLHARLRSDFARGVASNAAVVEVRGRRLLLVGLDLWARGNSPDSWEEARRLVEAAAIRDAIARVVHRLASERRSVDGVIVGGDMNLVAGRAPLDTMLVLTAGRFSGLALAPALHADGWSTWTWDGRGGPFHSARMDVMLYTEQALRASNGRIVNWDTFPTAERAALGPMNTPVTGLSRHRPIVVEFQWR